jgi:DnaJ-class molecular chaperone
MLGVDRDADTADIKLAFRKLAKVHHPDLNAGDAFAKERFQAIHSAYDILRRPDARASYDRACAIACAQAHRRMKSAAVAMAASFMLTVTSGLLVAGWMRIEGLM